MKTILFWLTKKVGRLFKSFRFPLFSTEFMSAWAWRAPNGDIYTAVKTAPAVVVLPYLEEDGKVFVLLIEQNRPELAGQKILKTVGSYIGGGETPEQAVVRCLDNKIKLRIEPNRLEADGRMLGYTVVDIPIWIFRVKLSGEEVKKVVNWSGNDVTVRLVPLDQAVKLAQSGQVGDDATAVPLYKFFCDQARPS